LSFEVSECKPLPPASGPRLPLLLLLPPLPPLLLLVLLVLLPPLMVLLLIQFQLSPQLLLGRGLGGPR